MNTTIQTRPGLVGRIRSRQSALPTGLLGRFFGRAMEGSTADSNGRALAMLDLSEPRTFSMSASGKAAPRPSCSATATA